MPQPGGEHLFRQQQRPSRAVQEKVNQAPHRVKWLRKPSPPRLVLGARAKNRQPLKQTHTVILFLQLHTSEAAATHRRTDGGREGEHQPVSGNPTPLTPARDSALLSVSLDSSVSHDELARGVREAHDALQEDGAPRY